jgi:hypothetical protein
MNQHRKAPDSRLTRLIWKERVKIVFWPGVVFSIALAAFSFFYLLNTPVAFDKVKGKVVRLSPLESEYSAGTRGFIELGDGRVISVIYRSGDTVPAPGAIVNVTRITMRLMGERFRAN